MLEQIPNSKVCTKCKKDLPISDFHFHPLGKYKLKSHCQSCDYLNLKNWRANNPEHFRRIGWTYELKKQYNLTPEEYEILLKEQNYGCAICGLTSKRSGKHMKLAVDHDHDTGKIRGLLCDSCNRGIGYLKNLSNLRKSIFYLMKGLN